MNTTIYTTPKIDAHCHLFDPRAFAYQADVAYRPSGGEIATAATFTEVMQCHGVRHALLVGPNSGYGTDNRCMLDAIRHGAGRFKGIAVVENDAPLSLLHELQAQGIVGLAFNFALLGLPHYANVDALFERAASLGLFVNVQVQGEQMAHLSARLLGCGAQILVDHHGRPDVTQGLGGAGFAALLGMAGSGRCTVKLSGYDKFSREPFPFGDAMPYTQALVAAFGPAHCLWASDWPHVRAVQRLDYAPLLRLFERSVPSAEARHTILWETPKRLFGFL